MIDFRTKSFVSAFEMPCLANRSQSKTITNFSILSEIDFSAGENAQIFSNLTFTLKFCRFPGYLLELYEG